MKITRINLIIRQLFFISILSIFPLGCATETEVEQPISEKTPISTSNLEIIQEEKEPEKNSEVTIEKTQTPISAIEEIAIEQPVELIEIENLIYFHFDRADLTTTAKAKLRQISKQLQDNDRQITIAGHADERGTHEYNLDLGQRRAETVKLFLASQGVDPIKLSTMSYGETRPRVPASNPVAWAQNRRVEFTIVQPTQAIRAQ